MADSTQQPCMKEELAQAIKEMDSRIGSLSEATDGVSLDDRDLSRRALLKLYGECHPVNRTLCRMWDLADDVYPFRNLEATELGTTVVL
jgi:hypothetical protein